MKLLSYVTKALIRFVFFVIKNNEAAKKYVLTYILKDEIDFFVEHHYYGHYLHIEKSCELAKKYIKSDGIIVDVGGADGTTGKIFSRYFPHVQIIIFEPLQENIAQLQKLYQSFSQWLIIPKAAGAKNYKKTIHKTKRITSSSLLKLRIDKDSKIFGDNLHEIGTESIEVTTLDKEMRSMKHIMILKLDVQGYELEVLKGAIGTLSRVSLILLELNNHSGYIDAPKYHQLDEFLRKHKFELYDIFPSTKENGKLKEWDAIYMNTSNL